MIISPDFVKGKRVLLRYDIDVALGKGTGSRLQVTEDFKLRAGLDTLKICLESASQVIMIGHVGRPEGKVDETLRVVPIRDWLRDTGFGSELDSQKLKVLENLRFDPREEREDLEYAKELAHLGDVYVNEAFSAYRPAVSTTVLPTLLPHAFGLHFAKEVEKLTKVRDNPKKPSVAILGGAKVTDKLPVIQVLAKSADAVLVGGKLVSEIRDQNLELPKNVMVGKLSEDGLDIAPETTESWKNIISNAKMIVWNGPLGKFEDPKDNQTEKIAQMVLGSGAEVIIGGGDTITALDSYHLRQDLPDNIFISVGGGAMLAFIADGTLPTIKALT